MLDLPAEGFQAVFAPGEGHDSVALRPDVIELKNQKVAYAAVDACRGLELSVDPAQVARLPVALSRRRVAAQIEPPPEAATRSSAAMAIHTDDFALAQFGFHFAQGTAQMSQYGYVVRLFADVIELQNPHVYLSTVRARMRG